MLISRVGIVVLGVLLTGCSNQPPESQSSMERSVLFRSLVSGDKNGICCAGEYLAMSGGPKWEDAPQTDEQWRAAARERTTWLIQQTPQELSRLDQGFSGYRATWQPKYSESRLR